MKRPKISKGLKRGFGSAMTLSPARAKTGAVFVKYGGISSKPIKALLHDDLKRVIRDFHDGAISVVIDERRNESSRNHK
jgi:hypothetical protein